MQHDDLIFMVEQAVKAPSGHNTQPWLFRVEENRIDILPNPEKELKVVDADRRELFVSLGCAAENLCIAASVKGYKADVSMPEDGSFVSVQFTSSSLVIKNPLYEQISQRQTNRNVYNGTVIKENIIYSLRNMQKEENVGVYFLLNGEGKYNVVADYIMKGNKIQLRDKAFKDELSSWIRYNKSHAEESGDGLSYAVFGAPNLPRCISEMIMKACLNPFVQNRGDKKKIQSSSHFVLFTTRHNSIKEWIGLGRTLERFLLELTASGIAYAFLNQPCEIKALSEQMKYSLLIDTEYPTILIRIGYGKKMPFSLRKRIDEVLYDI
ncbi:Acg family FMN-binding oxidoreductase [Parabacteroides bouchesdurhonensis]|uniref:Acg family FMN-binding oxidoreductase n=1 Tax=Parabacteroides bouchesdurhonensis TaxID=1936995 RepID=UPI000E48126A|nr:nitroreductase [Parabacteroides bouchesdurhonensis]RHJ90627.1 nitroreductase [Bacteroides sp. AM07-16]